MPSELIEKLGQFQDELEKLKKATDEIMDAGTVAKDSVELVEKTSEAFNNLLGPLNELIDRIKAVDFPRRFDELYRMLEAIERSVNSIGAQINNAKEEVKLKVETEGRDLKDLLRSELEKQAKQITFLKYINIVLVVSVLALLVLQIVK
jgi:ABC-type transporter Mla subunit MlaD